MERQRDEHDTNTDTAMCSSAFPSRMSKKRNVDLVKNVLPKSPTKKATVVATLMASPTTWKGLGS